MFYWTELHKMFLELKLRNQQPTERNMTKDCKKIPSCGLFVCLLVVNTKVYCCHFGSIIFVCFLHWNFGYICRYFNYLIFFSWNFDFFLVALVIFNSIFFKTRDIKNFSLWEKNQIQRIQKIIEFMRTFDLKKYN